MNSSKIYNLVLNIAYSTFSILSYSKFCTFVKNQYFLTYFEAKIPCVQIFRAVWINQLNFCSKCLRPPPSVIVYDPFLAHALFAAYVLKVPAVSFLTMPGPGVLQRSSAQIDALEATPWVQGPRGKHWWLGPMRPWCLYGWTHGTHGGTKHMRNV